MDEVKNVRGLTILFIAENIDIKAKLNVPEHLHEVFRPNKDCINKIIQFLNI